MPAMSEAPARPQGPSRAYRTPAIHAVAIEDALGPLPPAELLKAPRTLYAAGDVGLLQSARRVSIIGSRDASAEGQRRAAKLATMLAAQGVVIVSGLAKGIDAAAHRAAIDAGGRTIAVVGTPLDRAYPREHAELQERIARDHLVLSQFAVGSRVFPSNFVARNRVMALISHASVIVEAGDTSGSLSQASETQRLGRVLFFMRSVLNRPGLAWPAKFQNAGAVVLDDVSQVLSALPG